jgi:hypothetical protein
LFEPPWFRPLMDDWLKKHLGIVLCPSDCRPQPASGWFAYVNVFPSACRRCRSSKGLCIILFSIHINECSCGTGWLCRHTDAGEKNSYYLCIYIKMDVCVCVCSSITLERLEQIQQTWYTYGSLSLSLSLSLSIYIYIHKNGCMCVCVYVCSSITLEHLEQFQPNLVHIWLSIYIYIQILYYILYIWSIYKNECLCVCMFLHNSGTPGTIPTKFGTNRTIYIYKNIILYIICTYKWMYVFVW